MSLDSLRTLLDIQLRSHRQTFNGLIAKTQTAVNLPHTNLREINVTYNTPSHH